MDLNSSLELEMRMHNFKQAHRLEHRCVEVDVESEANNSFPGKSIDLGLSVKNTVNQWLSKALGIMSKITHEPVSHPEHSKSPRSAQSEVKIDELLQILEKLDDKLGPEFQEEVEEWDLIDMILSPSKEPLLLQYTDKQRIAEIIIGSMRNKQRENDRVELVADKLKRCRVKQRICETQIQQRDAQVRQLKSDIGNLTDSQTKMEAELENAYHEVFTLQELVKELNNELHGARFVLRDCLREGAGKFTREYLARSEDYDAKISSIISEPKSSKRNKTLENSPSRMSINEELTDVEERKFELLTRTTNTKNLLPFWKANI